jgi:hypothetical protein
VGEKLLTKTFRRKEVRKREKQNGISEDGYMYVEQGRRK